MSKKKRVSPIGIIRKSDSAQIKKGAASVIQPKQVAVSEKKEPAISKIKPPAVAKAKSPTTFKIIPPAAAKAKPQIISKAKASAAAGPEEPVLPVPEMPHEDETDEFSGCDGGKEAPIEAKADDDSKLSLDIPKFPNSEESGQGSGRQSSNSEEAVIQKELYVPVPFTQKRPQIPFDPARAIEAALFMSSRPLKREEIAKLIGTGSLGSVDTSVLALQKEYTERKSAIEISSENGIYSMRLKQDYVQQTKQFSTEAEISKHALKTLALVSKNEGITKRKLFGMLGSTIYSDCAELEEAGFISHRKAGRTSSLHTTPKFRDYFGGQ